MGTRLAIGRSRMSESDDADDQTQHTVPGMLLRHVFAASRFARRVSTTTAPKTAVIMLNMGGPSSLTGQKDGVTTFLTNLFTDPEIIPLGPLQTFLVRRTALCWLYIYISYCNVNALGAGSTDCKAPIAQDHRTVCRNRWQVPNL